MPTDFKKYTLAYLEPEMDSPEPWQPSREPLPYAGGERYLARYEAGSTLGRIRRAMREARAAKLMIAQATTPKDASRAEENFAQALYDVAKLRDDLARHWHYAKTGRDTDFDPYAMDHLRYGGTRVFHHPILKTLANRSR